MSNPIEARNVKQEITRFIWNDRIPEGMITTVAGRPDTGKGLTGALIAADVSQGKGGASHRKPARVLYSPNEDAHSLMTAPRLAAAGANMRNVLIWDFVLPEQLDELRWIVENGTPDSPGKIDLVIIDPWNSHLAGISRFSDALRTRVLNPLKELMDKTGVTIIVVEHVNKKIGKNADPLSVIGGNGSGLPAASRAAYLFGVDPDNEDQRVLAPVKFNVGLRPAAFAFEIDTEDLERVSNVPLLIPVGEMVIDPIRLVASEKKNDDSKIGRPADKRKAACEWLTRYLAQHGPTKSGLVQEDAKQAGIAHKTLRNARTDMDVVVTPPGGGKNVVWDLPDDIKDAMGLAHGDDGYPTDDAAREGGSDDASDDSATITDADLAALLGDDDSGS